jgi:hypothetical protein
MARDDTRIKAMGEESGSPENTSRINFIYRIVWGLKSEVQCLKCSECMGAFSS